MKTCFLKNILPNKYYFPCNRYDVSPFYRVGGHNIGCPIKDQITRKKPSDFHQILQPISPDHIFTYAILKINII